MIQVYVVTTLLTVVLSGPSLSCNLFVILFHPKYLIIEYFIAVDTLLLNFDLAYRLTNTSYIGLILT